MHGTRKWLLPIALLFIGAASQECERTTALLVADQGNHRIVQVSDFSEATWTTFDYPTRNPTLGAPAAIAVDSVGRIYASNLADNNISRMDDISGAGFVTLGSGGFGVGEFNEPFGIAVDARDRVYVADSGNGRIVRIDDIDGSGWTTLGRPGGGDLQFLQPTDVAIDIAGRIYVADRENRRIVRVDDMSGTGWTTYGGRMGLGPGRFDLLGGIAVGPEFRIYVTDSNENVVISIDDMTGRGYTNFGYVGPTSLFAQPSGIFVDALSTIWVASENDDRVARFENMQGVGYRTLGVAGSGEGQFHGPIDVVVAQVVRSELRTLMQALR